jgi:hypothetical protein
MRTEEQMAMIVARTTKELHHDLAKKWGFPVGVIADVTLGLGVAMMFESGYDEQQIIDIVRGLVADLTAPPDTRGVA